MEEESSTTAQDRNPLGCLYVLVAERLLRDTKPAKWSISDIRRTWLKNLNNQ